jgi:probable HAF family extracellular repeat protein
MLRFLTTLLAIGLVAARPAQADTIDYSSGFNSHFDLTSNGSATFTNGVARLTDGNLSEAGSVFINAPVNITRFDTSFTFQLTNAGADGFTFVLQGVGPIALGTAGGGLGYSDTIPQSVAVKFDIFYNWDRGDPSDNCTGLYVDGQLPFGGIDLNGTGVNLHSGNILRADLHYDGSVLHVTITDTATGASASQSYTVDIPSHIGGFAAYVGFTGGTGGVAATQDIRTWQLTSPTLPASAPAAYTLTDLETLGGFSSGAYGLNNRGQVVGSSLTGEFRNGSNVEHAFLWQNGVMHDIDTSGRDYSRATGINNAGVAAGYAVAANGYVHAALWGAGGDQNDLGPLFGGKASYGYGINDHGYVVGQGYVGSQSFATIWSPSGPYYWAPFTGYYYGEGRGLNIHYKAVGDMSTSDFTATHAFSYYSVTLLDLQQSPAYQSTATCINNSDQIAGYAQYNTAPGRYIYHAALWQNGGQQDLGALGPDGFSGADSINNLGQIVGYATTLRSDGWDQRHAFLTTNGAMIDLNSRIPASSGWQLTEATGINDIGQICGYGVINGAQHAFLLTPIWSKVSGVVTLQNCVNPANQPIRFEFRHTDGSAVFVRSATLDGSGAFLLDGVPAGSWQVAVKGAKWLQKVVPVDTSSGSATLSPTLRPGDIDGNNKVDIADLGLLADAFNTTPSSGNWNANADLNCDGKVNITDLGLLADNFNRQGDP